MRWARNGIKIANPERLTDLSWASRVDQMYRRQLSECPRGEYVYLLWDYENSTLYKIGRTQVPKNRIANLSTVSTFYILAMIPCKNSRYLEKCLHRRFARKLDSHEWFRLNTRDIKLIKNLELRLNTGDDEPMIDYEIIEDKHTVKGRIKLERQNGYFAVEINKGTGRVESSPLSTLSLKELKVASKMLEALVRKV